MTTAIQNFIVKPSTTAPLRNTRATWSPGDGTEQGDLGFICLPRLPKSAKPRKNRQLAEGDTRGSRHILVGGKCYDVDASELIRMISEATSGKVLVGDAKYIGPVIAGECIVEHPQHAHEVFPDHPCTAVIFQRNLSSEEREQRARD